MLKQDFTFLDLETTGFFPDKDSIIEVSFVRFINGKEIARVNQVTIPDKTPLNDFVAELTGISQDEIDKKGINFTEIANEITEKIGDSIIIGHNIDFDINFLIANNIPIKNNPRIDTHELARIFLPNEASFALEVLTEKYGFIHESAHRAMSDVLASKALFELLIQKISEIPREFYDNINQFLTTKTSWFAKELLFDCWENSSSSQSLKKYLENLSSLNKKADKPEETIVQTNQDIIYNFDDDLIKNSLNFDKNNTNYLKFSDSHQLHNFCKNISNTNSKKILIVSPKFNFYNDFKPFPTPEVIFDPQELANWSAEIKLLDNAETTFYLKCKFREFLGFRGLDFFDLFFKERDLWKKVCIQNSAHEKYQNIINEKLTEKTLTISPQAFLKFYKLFKDRILILDEAEMLAEQILNFPTEKYYLNNSLESNDDKIANASHFFVTDFCKNIIEPKLKREIGTFPEKNLLDRDKLGQVAEQILNFDKSEIAQFAAENLANPPAKMVRWFEYFPEKGDLTFGFWQPVDWQNTKNIFE